MNTTIKRTLAANIPAFTYAAGSGAVVANVLLAMNKSPEPRLAAALPYWGMAQSCLEIFSTFAAFLDDFDDFRYSSPLGRVKRLVYDTMTILANAELFNLSTKALHTGSLLFLYQGMVLTSAVKLLQSIGDFITLLATKNRTDAYAAKMKHCIGDLTYQAAKLAGWSLLLVGNPVGIAFLAACSLVTLKQLTQEYAPKLFGLFDHSSTPTLGHAQHSHTKEGHTFTYSYPNR